MKYLTAIAGALVAALTYVLTMSGYNVFSVNQEKDVVTAGQITEYAAELRTAASRMVLTGTAARDISFQTDMTAAPCIMHAENCLFSPSGGGETNQNPSAFAGAAKTWGYKDVSSPTEGFWVAGVGTDAVSGGNDAIAYLSGIDLSMCQQIQKGLGAEPTPPIQEVAIDWSTVTSTQSGTVPITAATANVLFGPGITAKAFACIQQTATGGYNYYHVLIEQ